jgi:hypothetical protein
MRLFLGHTIVQFTVRSPITIKVKQLENAFEVNGHLIEDHPKGMWPTYGLCHRCGVSLLGGADAWFTAVPCGEL